MMSDAGIEPGTSVQTMEVVSFSWDSSALPRNPLLTKATIFKAFSCMPEKLEEVGDSMMMCMRAYHTSATLVVEVLYEMPSIGGNAAGSEGNAWRDVEHIS